MCGRASLYASPAELQALFDLVEPPELEPRFNIAPTEPMAVIRTPGRLELLRFGLVPGWAKDPREGTRFLNARSETVSRQSAFREAVRARRCLVVVSGFFEWKTEGKMKHPFYIRRRDEKPFALAGLWSTWRSRDGEMVHSCAVITRAPSHLLAGVHDRMPVVLAPEEYAAWLDPETVEVASFFEGHAEDLTMHPVSPRVNNPGSNDPGLIAPIPEAETR